LSECARLNRAAFVSDLQIASKHPASVVQQTKRSSKTAQDELRRPINIPASRLVLAPSTDRGPVIYLFGGDQRPGLLYGFGAIWPARRASTYRRSSSACSTGAMAKRASRTDAFSCRLAMLLWPTYKQKNTMACACKELANGQGKRHSHKAQTNPIKADSREKNSRSPNYGTRRPTRYVSSSDLNLSVQANKHGRLKQALVHERRCSDITK